MTVVYTMLLLSIVAGFRIPTIRKLRACPKGGHERVGPLVANISRLVDFQSQTWDLQNSHDYQPRTVRQTYERFFDCDKL